MDTEINQNIIFAHIAGLTIESKEDLYYIFSKSTLKRYVDIVDIDTITNKIIEDKNMEILFSKFEYYSVRSKDKDLSQTETKMASTKAKNLEKKMFQYWKVKMEYYINKITSNSTKKIILIGYISFFKNHRININLNINPKFFIKVDYTQHAKSIIKYNLENSTEDIINGDFDLNYLDIDFLIKKRIQLQNIYSKINYYQFSIASIINILELKSQIQIPSILYYASFIKYDKKIPILNNIIYTYTEEWLALSAILTSEDNLNKIEDISTNVEKGINKNGNIYIRLSKDQIKKFNNTGYLYEITNTETFLPAPTKNNIYKYFSIKSIKINRVLEIDNVFNQIKQLKINILS